MVGGQGLHNREGSGEGQGQGQKKKGKDITATRGISVRGKKLRGPSRSNPPRPIDQTVSLISKSKPETIGLLSGQKMLRQRINW